MIPVAILAGGLATRLGSVTQAIPKSLVRVAGAPFIAHQLQLLQARGVERVVLCLGHLGHLVQQYVGDGRRWGLQARYSWETESLLGTGGALKHAAAMLDERFFVLYGDSYLEANLDQIDYAHQTSGKLGLMTVFRNCNTWDRSNIEFENGRILRYDKIERTPAMQHIDWGLGVLSAGALADFPSATPFDLASVYRRLLEQHELTGFEVGQRFYEIGSPDGLRETDAYLKHKCPTPGI